MTVRQIALILLDEYELGGKYVNLSLNSHLTDKLGREEKSFLTALVYTVVEHKLTYDYYIGALSGRSVKDMDIHTLNILRLGLCQIIDIDSVPDFAAVNETVALGAHKGERSFVNGVLRSAVRLYTENKLPLPDRDKNAARYLGVVYSYPRVLVKLFVSLFGEKETEELLSAFNSQSYTDIAVNTGLISREDYLARLCSEGIEARASERSAMSIRLFGSVNPRFLPGFDEGLFYVQDEICTVSAEALGIEKGDRIIDVCACPGGKSFAAAILAGSEGEVTSFDLHKSKLSLIESGRDRLRLGNIKVGACDALTPNSELFGTQDRVICDVPCSGLGVLGKKPDIRYKDLGSLEELPELQYGILCASIQYLKPGGVIVYSTCTLNPRENGDVVARFLAEHLDFEPCDFAFSDIVSEGGSFTALPHVHNTDGFFIAKMRRKAL